MTGNGPSAGLGEVDFDWNLAVAGFVEPVVGGHLDGERAGLGGGDAERLLSPQRRRGPEQCRGGNHGR